MFVIFLSNRVHPDGKGDVASLRGRVASIAGGAVTDLAVIARAVLEQTQYYETLIRDLAALLLPAIRRKCCFGRCPSPPTARVLTGIDVLERDGFKQLAGMRIGLVTNHTGRDRDGRQTIDVLNKAPGVKLVALFSPEHGIRGLADEKVSDSKDEQTGLPIYSLYGETRRPKPEQLKDLDALVFDIQDIGARFYTYISTLGYVMEEAAKAGLPVFVLDRPNPIGGLDSRRSDRRRGQTFLHRLSHDSGATWDDDRRAGPTFQSRTKISCDLRVIKMEGWQRAMWFDETNLTWINPSPNMRSLTEATLYPGVGLLETTNVSVGRGTDTPFEVVGAPWIDGQQLAAALNQRRLPGVRFVPVRFTPAASVFKDEECQGINVIITDRASVSSRTNRNRDRGGFETSLS